MKKMVLALSLVALFPAFSEAGLRDRLRARFGGGNSCATCAVPAAAAPTAKPEAVKKDAPKVAPVSACEGGNCPAPSARRGILGFRR